MGAEPRDRKGLCGWEQGGGEGQESVPETGHGEESLCSQWGGEPWAVVSRAITWTRDDGGASMWQWTGREK